MFNLLLQIKDYYLKLKKYYYSIVLIEKKNFYYYHQTINYFDQNIYGLIHNIISSLWLLLVFSFLLKDIIYLYLCIFILFFCLILFLLVRYIPYLIPVKFLTGLLSLSYFYKSESELMNLIIYILFLFSLSLAIFFGVKTYFFIRLLFFFRCFLTFIYLFYQSFPNLQIQLLKNCLIVDEQLLDVLHPMEKINVDDFIKLKLENNEVNKDKALELLKRYNEIKKQYEIGARLTYERKVQDDQIIVIGYTNIIESLTKLLDKTEEKLRSAPDSLIESNIIELKKNEEK